MIGTNSEIDSGKSVLAAQLDNDDYNVFIYLIIGFQCDRVRQKKKKQDLVIPVLMV